ncbi:hypothetical protein [Crocinitomix algicola]|uniref:hypothetical protein n=1 Tax=Crocinitomix algicola TaxID=1740263 RepID=UPI00082D1897|nr:hypothetical protein [Crocinitomix algicola]
MKKKILFGSFLSFLFAVSSCGSLTESEAKTMLNAEAESLALSACDCINNLAVEGDQLIEEVATCNGNAQSKLDQKANDEGITDNYPEVVEDAHQLFFEAVQSCTK